MDWTLYPISDFANYIAQWDTLNQNNTNTPLLCSVFVVPLIKHFANQEKDRLAICGDKNNPVAMTIITKRKLGVWETLQPSQAPIGLWIHQQTTQIDILLASLLKKLPFPSLLFGVTQQDPDCLPRPEKQNKIGTLDYIQTARVTLQGSFDDYWSQRGKNLRQNLRRQRNRLEREDTITTLKTISKPEYIEEAIIAYGKMESSGWKNEGGTAIHIDNDQGKFYRDMLANFCHTGNGLIFQYFYNDQLVSTDLCIKDKNCLIILKTTYDESITTTSPAMLMRQDAFEYIFEQQFTKNIEFYGKVMDWHTKWSDEIRTMYHINSLKFKLMT